MNPIIAKTFGGLSPQYYFRQLVFGLIFTTAAYVFESKTKHPTSFVVIVMFALNSLLYPYARFVYEGIMDFIIGRNVFWGSAISMLFIKFITMATCWTFAIFIAPVGLAYLYYHHSKNNSHFEL